MNCSSMGYEIEVLRAFVSLFFSVLGTVAEGGRSYNGSEAERRGVTKWLRNQRVIGFGSMEVNAQVSAKSWRTQTST